MLIYRRRSGFLPPRPHTFWGAGYFGDHGSWAEILMATLTTGRAEQAAVP